MGPTWGTGTSEIVSSSGSPAKDYLAAICYVEQLAGVWTEAVVAFNGSAGATSSAWDSIIGGIAPFPDLSAPGGGTTPSGLLAVRGYIRCTASGSCSLYGYGSLADFKSDVLDDVARRTGVAKAWLQSHHQYLQSQTYLKGSSIPNGCGANCPPSSLDDTWNELVEAVPGSGSNQTAAWIHAEKKDIGTTPPQRVIRQVTNNGFGAMPVVSGYAFLQKPAGTTLDVDDWMKDRNANWVSGSTYCRIVMQYLAPL